MGTEDIRCRIMEEELGTFWPQWHVVKRLGGGSFGDVFEIFRDNYGIRTFSALKVLRISDAEASYSLSSGNARPYNAEESCSNFGENNIPEVFMNEIRIMEALRGAPNIVSIENFHFRKNAETNSLYVRMELLTSFVKVMSDRQRSGRQFTIPEVLKIGKDICTALSFCEQRNIIHRDIKPANMFVDKFGNYKVGDFGASKRMETIHPTHMMTGIGTISYMAPEIFAGRSYNNTVDIYALGLVLYQLLNNGRMPFLPAYGQYTVQDIDAANYRRLHREELPPLAGIRIYGEMIDERLDSVIRKACDPDSHRRYRTAREFYDALSGHEVREDNTETISTTVRTTESSYWEPNQYQKSEQQNSASAAGYADHEKAYAQKEAGIQKARGEEGINLALVIAIVFFIALPILVTTGVTSSSASEEANQSIQAESDDSTVIDEDEELTLKSPVQVISLGAFHSAAIDTDGNLWMWGHNEFDGQLGNGSTEEQHEPVKIMDEIQSVSLGSWHSAAIKTDGSLWMWGNNQYGQLGDGRTEDSYTPVKIMDEVQSVALGGDHSAAIKTDGSLWMWGWNEYGQLGNGSTEEQHEPVKIMDEVQSVTLGDWHSAVIKTDGSLWMWGGDSKGQLGDGRTGNSYTPLKIMDEVQSVALGGAHSAAVKTDGSLWIWGGNDFYGQLGDGSEEDRHEPVKIMDDVQSVSLGEYFSAAIKTDGSLWMWGDNSDGELGDGSAEDRHEPVKIMDDVQSVSLGCEHTIAIKTDGSLWVWGSNEHGQLGDGSAEDHYEPVCIAE